MKLKTNTRFEKEHVVTPAEAVTYVADRAVRRDDHHPRARAEALEKMLGELLTALVQNGALRTEQVEAIFDYDVSAED